MDDVTLGRWADLIVNFAANVQEGQVVSIAYEPGQEPGARAIADAAYRAGALFVDPQYFDPYLKHARLLHADADTLDWVPPWAGERLLKLGELAACRISLAGNSAPADLMDDIDPARAGKDRLPMLKESMTVVNEGRTNWCIAPYATLPWAKTMFPDAAPEEALAELERMLLHVMRLDEEDPVALWRERADAIEQASSKINEARFDAVRFVGPGTDLTVGLLPTSKWDGAGDTNAVGTWHLPNIPTEETFTSPDPERTSGHVTSTKPLVLRDGTIVRDLQIRFEGGVAVEVNASSNVEVMRALVAAEGASRLGEVALVDGQGRIGALDTVFYTTLLDENAASHIALGGAYLHAVDEADRPRLNESVIHEDFMIGSPEVEVYGLSASGDSRPVLIKGEWQL